MIGHGTTISGSVAGDIGEIVDIPQIANPSVTVNDDSDMASVEQWEEKAAGWKNAGQATFTVKYTGEDTAEKIHNALGILQNWTITSPVPSGKTTGATLVCAGIETGYSIAAPLKDEMRQDVTIEFSGKPTFTKAA